MTVFQGSFEKYASPVFGDASTGTMFDAFVRERDGRLRMDVSWRPEKALAVTFSDDGIHWEKPVITLGCDPSTGWEDIVNRNCVLPDPAGNGWLMWYTGQVWNGDHGRSWIGLARSEDGISFHRFRKDPVLSPETPFERESVMNPFVLYEDGRFRMWYAAGETYEPNAIYFAESEDGEHWRKDPHNPVFTAAPENEYERERIGACDVLREEDGGYLMFYIGYRDIHTASISAARSRDGITGWVRVPENPLVTPTPGGWDADSCYKPTAVRASDGSYRLWYNGRRAANEYIGYAAGRLSKE